MTFMIIVLFGNNQVLIMQVLYFCLDNTFQWKYREWDNLEK